MQTIFTLSMKYFKNKFTQITYIFANKTDKAGFSIRLPPKLKRGWNIDMG